MRSIAHVAHSLTYASKATQTIACSAMAAKKSIAHVVDRNSKGPVRRPELAAEEDMAPALYWYPLVVLLLLLVPSKLEMGCEPAK